MPLLKQIAIVAYMKLLEYFEQRRGLQIELAKAIGASQPDVARWAKGTRAIPLRFGPAIERATRGLVKRQDLYSEEVCRDVWPDLAPKAKGSP